MAGKNYTVRIDGHEVPEGPSETGEFGLSKGELKLMNVSAPLILSPGESRASQGARINSFPTRSYAIFRRKCT